MPSLPRLLILMLIPALAMAVHPSSAWVQASLSSDLVIRTGEPGTIAGIIQSSQPGEFQALIFADGELISRSAVRVEDPLRPGFIYAEFRPQRAGDHIIQLAVRDSMGRILAQDSREIRVIPRLPPSLASMLPQLRAAGEVEFEIAGTNLGEWRCYDGYDPSSGIMVVLFMDKRDMRDEPRAEVFGSVYDMITGKKIYVHLIKLVWGCPVKAEHEYTCVDSGSMEGYTLEMHFSVKRWRGEEVGVPEIEYAYDLTPEKAVVKYPEALEVADPNRADFGFCGWSGYPGYEVTTRSVLLSLPYQKLFLSLNYTKPDRYKRDVFMEVAIRDDLFGITDKYSCEVPCPPITTPMGYKLRANPEVFTYGTAWPGHPNPGIWVMAWVWPGSIERPAVLPGKIILNSTQPETQYAVSPVGCILPENCTGTVGLEPVEISISAGNYTVVCSKPDYACTNCPINITVEAGKRAEASCQMQVIPPAFFDVKQILANGKPCPVAAPPDKPVEISAVIVNAGGMQGTKRVTLSRDGVGIREWDVTLGPGDSITLSHSETPPGPGKYTYTFSTPDKSLSCSVSVAPPVLIPAWVWILVAGAVALGAAGAVRRIRR